MSYVLTPEDVRAKYGPMFCKGLYTIVDERNGIARIIEVCSSRGPVEWDSLNRKRSEGIVRDISLDGNTMVTDVFIGKRTLTFGHGAAGNGAQGIESLKIIDGEVHTKWKGIAGAGMGIGSCLPQAPGVIMSIYPDDFKIGGSNVSEVEIVTPIMIRVLIGVDDTDSKDEGATWVMMMRLAKACPYGTFLMHRIIQLNSNVNAKTSTACASALAFAVEPKDLDKLVDFCKRFIERNTVSDGTAMAVYKGLKASDRMEEWGWNAKNTIYTVDQAIEIAFDNDIGVYEITGSRGIIGAVAAVSCFDLGLKAAGFVEDFDEE